MAKKFHISAFSKGLYSNWFWHHPSRTLFDCGEGFATYAGNFIFGVERICISHACHGDHIGGLATFIGIRNSSRGDKEKPLDIYYPGNDVAILDYQDFIKRRFGNWLTFKINWHPTMFGEKIPLDSNHWIESFELSHTKRSSTIGYKIIEGRSRLRAKWKGLDIPALLKNGLDKSQLNENYNAITLAYCLDAFRIDSNHIVNAELAIMDCSFLNVADRDESTHFSLNESLALCAASDVKHVVIAHISSRYDNKKIQDATDNLSPEDYTVIWPNKVNEF